MAKDDSGNQLNLTVVALVALVAIVGLVALVLNTAGLARLSTGGALAVADDGENLAGQPVRYPTDSFFGGGGGTGDGRTCSCTSGGQKCDGGSTKNACEAVGCSWNCA